MATDIHGLGANTVNRLIDDVKAEAVSMREAIRSELMVDGVPPGHDRLMPHEQLAKLEQMRQMGDPAAFSPEAYEDERRLRARLRGGR